MQLREIRSMIEKIRTRNFPGLGDVDINCKSDISDITCMLDGKQYILTNLLLEDSSRVVSGYDLLGLFLCTLTRDEPNFIKSYFNSDNTYIYVDFYSDTQTYHYVSVINKTGYIKENLFEVNSDGVKTEITLDRRDISNFTTAVPSYVRHFFDDIVYYSYELISDNKEFMERKDDGFYDYYFGLLEDGMSVYDNHLSNVVELMRKLGITELSDIQQVGSSFQIYYNDGINFTKFENESERFINLFFLAICVLETLFRGKILFLSGFEKNDDRVAAKIYNLYNLPDYNTLGAQVFITSDIDLLDRVNYMDEQVTRIKTVKQL